MSLQEDDPFALHRCVFEDNIRKLSSLLRVSDIAAKDKHGNTALHLAIMLGRRECTYLLLAHGAPVKQKNLLGWNPLAEAVSYGDRQIILSMVRRFKQQLRDAMEERRPNLVKALNSIPDFQMQLKWDFQSWVPLVSRFLPSDLCRISKKGTCIRFDSTLVDFNDMKWEHGDITFLYNGSARLEDSLLIMDNNHKVFQLLSREETDSEMEDEVDSLMSNDLICAQMSTKGIEFSRAQSGWIFREDRKEMVGPFNCDYYSVTGIVFESRKRREHLSQEDLQKNKLIMEAFTRGSNPNISNGTNHQENNHRRNSSQNRPPPRRQSLPPPPKCRVSWEEYIKAEPGNYPTLGRELAHKESARAYKATVAMCEDFPLSVDMLLNVLEVIAPFKHFHKLRQFVQLKLPPGFPVKLDIPVLPTVSAKVTFQEFRFVENMPQKLFEVPKDYREDPNRFPDL